MHFTVENEALAKALALVKGCVPPRTTIPILTHVAVDALDDGLVAIRSTNMERECEVHVPAEVEVSGQVTLPGEILIGLVKRLAKGGQAAFKLDGDRCRVVSNSSHYDLRTLPIADFPPARAPEDGATRFGMPASDLKQLIQSTSYAHTNSIVKAYYAGSNLHVAGDKLKMAATDDHRLALKAVDLPKGAADMPSVTIPTDAVREMVSLLEGCDDIELIVGNNQVELRRPGIRFVTALIACVFPDYKRVVPKMNGAAATFRPYAVAEAAKRASVVYLGETNIHRKVPIAQMSVSGGGIKLEAGHPGNEQALEAVEAESIHYDLTFRTRVDYLTEMLEIWPDNATVGVQQAEPGGPILFAVEGEPGEIHIVMPQIP